MPYQTELHKQRQHEPQLCKGNTVSLLWMCYGNSTTGRRQPVTMSSFDEFAKYTFPLFSEIILKKRLETQFL